MTAEGVPTRDGLGAWCGWVMVGVAGLTPWMAWLGPLGFAALMALAGLLCLPAVRIPARQTPLAIILLLGLAWAGFSTLWTAQRAQVVEDSVALKLAVQLPLYFAAWCGARRADPSYNSVCGPLAQW